MSTQVQYVNAMRCILLRTLCSILQLAFPDERPTAAFELYNGRVEDGGDGVLVLQNEKVPLLSEKLPIGKLAWHAEVLESIQGYMQLVENEKKAKREETGTGGNTTLATYSVQSAAETTIDPPRTNEDSISAADLHALRAGSRQFLTAVGAAQAQTDGEGQPGLPPDPVEGSGDLLAGAGGQESPHYCDAAAEQEFLYSKRTHVSVEGETAPGGQPRKRLRRDEEKQRDILQDDAGEAHEFAQSLLHSPPLCVL